MSGRWASKYTDRQREALASAYVDQGIRPAARVVALAKEGALRLNGEQLDPFETNANTVRDEVRKLRKRRAGQVDSQLAALPPRDAIEVLRRRLVNVADSELTVLERTKPGTRDLERMRQISRAIFEAARLPGPSDARPSSPDTKNPETGQRTGVDTKGGLAGAILSAHRSNGTERRPSSDDSGNATATHGEEAPAQHSDAAPSSEQAQDDGGPGSWARSHAAAVLGER